MDRGRRRSTPARRRRSTAENTSTLDATATSKIEGFDKTFGAVVAFNSIGWKSSNILFNALDALLGDPLISSAFDGAQTPSDAQAWIRDTTLDVGGDVTVTATQAAQLTATAGNEGAADAELDSVLSSGCGDHRRLRRRRARLEQGQHAGEGVHRVHRRDAGHGRRGRRRDGRRRRRGRPRGARERGADRDRREHRGRASRSAISDLLPNDNDYTTKSGTRDDQRRGDHVRIGPDDGALGVAGHVYEFKGLGDGRRPRHCGGRTTPNTTLLDGPDDVQPSIADFYPNLGNLTKSDARAIGLLVVMNDLRAKSEAYLDNALVDAGGSSRSPPRRRRSSSPRRRAPSTASGGSFYGTGTVQAINGQVVTNVVLASATASITDSDVTAGGDVTVTAANHAGIDATLLAATNSGDLARRDHARVQLARLEVAEHPLQPRRHDPRRRRSIAGALERRGSVARHARRSRTRRSTPAATSP